MQTCSAAAGIATNASSSQSHRIAVVGGGISGLTFARVLQNNGHNVVIYEREQSPTSRSQGGTLDLHVESGQWALREADLYTQFQALIREGGEDLRLVDQSGKVLIEEVGNPADKGRPEIDRPALRGLLLDSLQSHTVKWGHHLVAIKPQPSHGHSLLFADGTAVTADIVIGADGARSQVRSLVTDAQPGYCGAGYFDLKVLHANQTHPELAKFVGRGNFFALGNNKGILAQHYGDGNIAAYATCRLPESRFTQLQRDKAWETAATSRQAVAALFEGWAPEITNLIHACEDTIIPRKFQALPVGLTWPSQPNVTLLGDAAHVMSPFAGEGANLAMQDGAELALELVKASDPADAIAAYEAKMFERAEASAEQSAQGLDMIIAPNGAENLANFFRSHGEGEQ